MSDKLVFDLAQEVEGTPNVFVRKDWINILDNQNQNYNNNQSVIDTSQLSNSNKYMSYRESYFLMPFVLTLASDRDPIGAPAGGAVTAADFAAGQGAAVNYYFTPQIATAAAPGVQTGKGCDYAIGLKNWFGQIIHSFTLDYNGTTIIQQTPYVNMWNTFKLLTSLSYQDILTQGAQIGFYPDSPDTFTFCQSQAIGALAARTSLNGSGTCNNSTAIKPTTTYGSFTGLVTPYVAPAANGVINNVPLSMNNLSSGCGNSGLVSRMKNINFDSCGLYDFGSPAIGAGGITSLYTVPQITTASFFNGGAGNGGAMTSVNQLWKSYVYNKVNAIAGTAGVWQCAIMATVYLKHIHSFFNMCPLLKGVFMKMTMNLNNSTTQFACVSTYSSGGADTRLALVPTSLELTAGTTVPVGGVNPVMIASAQNTSSIGLSAANQQILYFGATSTVSPGAAAPLVEVFSTPMSGSVPLFPIGSTANVAAAIANAGSITQNYFANISVGGKCLNNAVAPAAVLQASTMSQSVYLYIPAYTFNPVFEQAYLSSPVKQIKYTDIYQYQVLNVSAGGQFNNLITNGIANIKSVLIIPYFSSTGPAGTTGLPAAVGNLPVFQSPFDPAGCGSTSPFIALTNFNIQVSGQNAIYNVQRYNFEEWNNQLYGQNSVNGGLTDGLTSGLIDRAGFDSSYGYYYVNVERMLPVEQSVPKSIQILGQNQSSRNVDLYVFIEYGVDISIDAITGARV